VGEKPVTQVGQCPSAAQVEAEIPKAMDLNILLPKLVINSLRDKWLEECGRL